MMTNAFVFSFFAILSISHQAFAVTTYWVQPQCSNYGNLATTIDEIILAATELLREFPPVGSTDIPAHPRLNQWLKWFFNFDFTEFDPMGYPYSSYVRRMPSRSFLIIMKTDMKLIVPLIRLSGLQRATSQESATIRIHCMYTG